MLPHPRPAVLLATADLRLSAELERLLATLHLAVVSIADSRHLLAVLPSATEQSASPQLPGLLLLDSRLPDVASGRLLAALSEPAIRRNWAIALLAEDVPDTIADEWLARHREGILDDIVPRSADAAAWKIHLNTMQRSHALFCEVEQLREASLLEIKRDPLTGTLNRDTLLTVLFRETDRIQRQSGALTLMAIDLDAFRHWNHKLGRDAGDQLLRESARRVTRLLRTYDVLGRTGGDEFLLILPGCSIVNATLLAERLRNEVFAEPFWVHLHPHRSHSPANTQDKAEIAEVHLSASYAIASSRGRSPVVVLREVEQTLRDAAAQGPGAILGFGDRLAASAETPQLFSEAETAIF
jgi:diguanylate cyclase (GGDEF)-like protein